METVTQIFEEIKEAMCDDYCRYPREQEWDEEEYENNNVCSACPLNRL